jgi:O-acetyl-ADP-ribose deacetylase (regulator of RNase III)
MTVPVEIDVWHGEISDLEVDAIVVPANESLFMTTGAAASVKRHGGEEIEREAARQGPIGAGNAVITGGGQLPAPYVIHAVAVGHDLKADVGRLRAALRAALELAEGQGLRRLAVAPLGIERGVFHSDQVAPIMLEELAARSLGGVIESVVVATSSPRDAVAFREAIEAGRAPAR